MEDELVSLEDVRGIAEGLEQCSAIKIGGIAASDQKYLFIAPKNCTILGVTIVSDVTTASSGSTKDFAFNIQNLTTSVSLSGTPMDTDTKEITADTAYDLTIDQNTDVLAGAVLELQVTKTGAPTDLTNAEIIGVVKYKDNSYS